MEIEVGNLVREEIRIVLGDLVPAGKAHAQSIRHQRAAIGNAAFEDARFVHALEVVRILDGVVFPEHRDRLRARLEHAHHGQRRAFGAGKFVVAEQRARLVVRRLQQRTDFGLGQLAGFAH